MTDIAPRVTGAPLARPAAPLTTLPGMDIRIVNDPDGVADLAAASIARWLRDTPGRADLSLAGGGTPRATYLRLREEEVPWEGVDVWMGDERWVPPDHPENNGRMAREALMDHVPARFHAVPWEAGDPDQAAAAYARTLRGFIADDGTGPRPGVVVLGIGDDGHTASLFPDGSALSERERIYVADDVPGKGWRVTATMPLLTGARRIAFLATGTAKAGAVAAVLEEGRDLPARRVATTARGEVTWFLDRQAAAGLRRV